MPYALMLVALAMIAVGGLMSWETLGVFLHMYRGAAPSKTAARRAEASSVRVPAWQQDVLANFQQALHLTKTGHITGAEMQLDQAASEMEDARVRSKHAAGDFFSEASDALNFILQGAPQASQDSARGMASARLFEHVTQARIELAAMRSAQEPEPPDVTLAAEEQASADATAETGVVNTAAPVKVSSSSASGQPAANAPQQTQKLPAGHIEINAPRELAADSLLDPASAGGNFLDASMLPDEAEILLPPETRKFSDGVRVENLTMAGASQTLDGIHWRNVTFIGTRLRYEDGQLDLQNVRFVHCTFGFPSDARGAALANAIATDKTSFEIQ